MLIGSIIIAILSDMAESSKIQLRIQGDQYNRNIITSKNQNIDEIIGLVKEKLKDEHEEEVFPKLNILLSDTMSGVNEYQISIFYSSNDKILFSFDSEYVDNVLVEDLRDTLDKVLNSI